MPENDTNPIVLATKCKLRFSANGQLSVEDLWDLPLSKLDEIAVATAHRLHERFQTFLAAPARNTSSEQRQDELRLEVLRLVIDIKQREAVARREASERRANREFLQQLLEKKKLDQMASLSVEDIELRLAALGDAAQ